MLLSGEEGMGEGIRWIDIYRHATAQSKKKRKRSKATMQARVCLVYGTAYASMIPSTSVSNQLHFHVFLDVFVDGFYLSRKYSVTFYDIISFRCHFDGRS